MFENNLNPPPPKKKSLSNVQTKCNIIAMIADDAAMNVISWIRDLPSQNPF